MKLTKNNKYIIMLIIFFILIFIINNFAKNKKLPIGDVQVLPIESLTDFYSWYDKTIGDYNQDGSIPFLNDYYQLYLIRKNKI